jgi:hypothetical protein
MAEPLVCFVCLLFATMWTLKILPALFLLLQVPVLWLAHETVGEGNRQQKHAHNEHGIQ